MAGPSTSVSLEGMKAAQGDFQNALDEANSSYSSMAGQIDALRASWTGDASSTFQSAMDTWLQDFATVRSQLSLMFEKLQANTGGYADTHQTTTDAAAQVRQGMAGLPGF
ncbi:WXG100 family type VII secretion target [Streptomyces sp. NPDC093970]|uniref:WXG100 family type VII secretion target n=1 Tax=unclassified Streptomyces TaxID=2593676 RepID=UPI00341C0E25